MFTPCAKSNQLRFSWYESGKETDLARLRLHYKNCKVCKERQQQLTKQAEAAVMPDLTIEQLEAA
jgi:hypothetical protein